MKIGIFFVILLFVPVGILGDTISKNSVNLLPSNIEHVEISLTTNRTITLTGFSASQLTLYVLENDNYDKWLNQSSFNQIHSQFINQSYEIQLNPEVTDNYRLHFVFANFDDQVVELSYDISINDIKTNKLGIEMWLSFLSFSLLAIGLRKKSITFAR